MSLPPTWPRIAAHITAHRAEISLAGRSRTLTGEDLEDVRKAAIAQFLAHAAENQRSLWVDVHDPEGTYTLIATPDGTIRDGADAQARAKKAARKPPRGTRRAHRGTTSPDGAPGLTLPIILGMIVLLAVGIALAVFLLLNPPWSESNADASRMATSPAATSATENPRAWRRVAATRHVTTGSNGLMPAKRVKRQWGEGKSLIALNVRLKPENKTKIDRIADALGISAARALDLVMENVEVDGHGRPSWYEGELDTDNQEELPLTG